MTSPQSPLGCVRVALFQSKSSFSCKFLLLSLFSVHGKINFLRSLCSLSFFHVDYFGYMATWLRCLHSHVYMVTYLCSHLTIYKGQLMCMKERHLQSTADVYESEDFRLQTGYRMQTADFLRANVHYRRASRGT